MALLVLMLASYLCTAVYSPEFFHHLLLGRYILSHFAVPRENLWTYAGLNGHWSSASWMFESLLGLIERGGDYALLSLKFGLFIALAAACTIAFSREAKDKFFGTLLAFLVCPAVLLAVCLEARLAGYVCFTVSWAIFFGLDRKSLSPLGWLGAIGLAVIYANLHASSAAVVAGFAITAALTPREAPAIAKRRLQLLAAFTAAQLCSPYYGGQALAAISAFATYLESALGDQVMPATVFFFPAAFLALVWMIAGVLFHYRTSAFAMDEFLPVFFSTMIALSARSFVPYAAVLAGFMTARIWARGAALSDEPGNLIVALRKLQTGLERMPAVGVLWLILCLAIVNAVNLYKVPITKALLPARELDYLLEHDLPSPVLHEAAIGGYLIYRFADAGGAPRRLAAWSSRVLAMAPELDRVERKMQRLTPGWEKSFELIQPMTVLCAAGTPLYELLRRDANWKRVFEGGREIPEDGLESNPARLPAWALFLRRGVERPAHL